MNLLREGKREEHHRLLKLKRLVDDLLGYLEENWNGIYGSRNLECLQKLNNRSWQQCTTV